MITHGEAQSYLVTVKCVDHHRTVDRTSPRIKLKKYF